MAHDKQESGTSFLTCPRLTSAKGAHNNTKWLLVALTLRLGIAVANCRTKLLETPPALAISVAVCAELTGDTVAVNPALAAFAGTVTVAGPVTAALLLDRLTLSRCPAPPRSTSPYRHPCPIQLWSRYCSIGHLAPQAPLRPRYWQ